MLSLLLLTGCSSDLTIESWKDAIRGNADIFSEEELLALDKDNNNKIDKYDLERVETSDLKRLQDALTQGKWFSSLSIHKEIVEKHISRRYSL